MKDDLTVQNKMSSCRVVWSTFITWLQFDHNSIMNLVMNLWTWTNFRTSNACIVAVSSAPALIIHPFCANWLRDYSNWSLPIIKVVWQRPLLPLGMFFIHGHEPLGAVCRSQQAKTVNPFGSVLLMSWGRWNNKDESLGGEVWCLTLLIRDCFWIANPANNKLSSKIFLSPNAVFSVTHFLAEHLAFVWVHCDPEWASSFCQQETNMIFKGKFFCF